MTEPVKPAAPHPFASNADYLDLAFQHLAARSRRIGAETQLREKEIPTLPLWHTKTLGPTTSVPAEETRRLLAELKAEEERLRVELDTRLLAHREDPGRNPLGIDTICQKSGLGDEERVILLTCVAVTVSSRIAREILEPFGGSVYGGVDVEVAMALLEPRGTAGWLRIRRYFHRTAPMVRDGHVAVSFSSTEVSPADILTSTIGITASAFEQITGSPDTDDEDPTDQVRARP